jgi:CheY-like chemotaxis protein
MYCNCFLVQTEVVMRPSQPIDPSGAGPERSVILVVEDEVMLALELEQVLITAGHEVVIAADGLTALAYAADPGLRLRAAIINLNLPGGMPGHEVVRRLRAPHARLPVVVVTGYAPLAPQADLRGLGGPTARLQKPIEAQYLLQRLQEAMASNSGVA